MKSKKGFTLIELLAVIVVLAVIALIAIPIITNVIDKARVGALKDSAYGILDAGEVYLASNLKDGIESNLTFSCTKNKCTSDDKEINYKGNINAGTLILTTDSKTLVCVDNGKNYALKLANEKEVTTGIGTCGSYEEANGNFELNTSNFDISQFYLKNSDSVQISWDKVTSATATATYKTPKKCIYICTATVSTSAANKVLNNYSVNFPGTNIYEKHNSDNTLADYVNIGEANENEDITCEYFGSTSTTYATIDVKIYTNIE